MVRKKQQQAPLPAGCTALTSAVPAALYSKALGKRMVGSNVSSGGAAP